MIACLNTVLKEAEKILNRFKKALNGAKVLVLGVAYKQDIDDYRESPAIKVIEELEKVGAEVSYYDPYIKHYNDHGNEKTGLASLTDNVIKDADLVMVTTAHTKVDYERVQKHAKFIFDTKNAMKHITKRDNIELL